MHKIFLVDDHRLFLDGLQYILRDIENFKLDCFTDPFKALEAFENQEVDLVVTDINMNGLNGLELMDKLRAIKKDIKLLAVSVRSDASLIKRLLDKNVEGYLPKNSSKEQFISTVEKILNGEKHYDMNYLFNHQEKNTKEKNYQLNSEHPLLSNREKQVLQLIIEGKTTLKIAEQLFLSEHTINSHRKNIAFKLDANNLAELITTAMRLGLAKI